MPLALLFLLLCLCACANPLKVLPQEPGTLRVAACQILVDGDREGALVRIDHALAMAREQGAQIAVFPEACLFGWVNPAAHAAADPIPGATTEYLGRLARKHRIMLVVGLAERAGEHLHNAVVLIDRDGTLLLKHRKLNILSELMSPPYVPGESAVNSVVETRYGRIGLLICADTFQEESVAELASAAPDLVLVPYGWAAPKQDWPEHGKSLHAWIAATARRTKAPVLGVDSVGEIVTGPWKGYPLGGQSAFSNALGELSLPMADRRPEVRVFSVLGLGCVR
ncbi:MAG: putative amidohydrolase [Planctomycetota bacterium]|jgi:predicted amidohydrolase